MQHYIQVYEMHLQCLRVFVFLTVFSKLGIAASLLTLQLVTEFAECHINIVRPEKEANSDVLDDLPLEGVTPPVTQLRLGIRFNAIVSELNRTKFERKHQCTLMLTVGKLRRDEMYSLTFQFRWLTDCDFFVKDSAGSSPLCLSKETYFVFLRSAKSDFYIASTYRVPVFEITFNADDSIRLRAFPSENFCQTVLSIEFVGKYQEIFIRQFLRIAQGTIFENSTECPWIVIMIDANAQISSIPSLISRKKAPSFRNLLEERVIESLFRPQDAQGHTLRSHSFSVQKLRPKNMVNYYFTGRWVLTQQLGRHITRDAYFAISKHTHFNFITCEDNLFVSFSAYGQPFEARVWACVIFTFVFSFGCIYLKDKLTKSSSSSIFLVIRIIFEQETSLPIICSKTGSFLRTFSLFLCVTWFLITNAYRGKITTNITAPLPSHRLTTIEEAVANDYLVLMRYADFVQNFTLAQVTRPLIEELAVKQKWIFFILMLNSTMAKDKGVALRYNSTYQRIVHKLFALKGSDVMENFVVTEFDRCGKSILIGETADLITFSARAYKRSSNLKIYSGQEPILAVDMYWVLRPTYWDKSNLLKIRYDSYTHSGLFAYDFSENTTPGSMTAKGKELRPMQLRSNISSLFIILTTLTLGCTVILSLELFQQKKARTSIVIPYKPAL